MQNMGFILLKFGFNSKLLIIHIKHTNTLGHLLGPWNFMSPHTVSSFLFLSIVSMIQGKHHEWGEICKTLKRSSLLSCHKAALYQVNGLIYLIFIHLSFCMCMCEKYVYGTEVGDWYFPWILLSFIYWGRISCRTGDHRFTWSNCKLAVWILGLILLSVNSEVTSTDVQHWYAPSNQTLILTLEWKVLYPLSHLSSHIWLVTSK